MPTYDYYCQTCDITKEDFHSMKENPEIKCDICCNVMKKIISGDASFIIKNGSTRNQTPKSRFSRRKRSSLSTPLESSFEQAKQGNEKIKTQYDPKDPYKQFKDKI